MHHFYRQTNKTRSTKDIKSYKKGMPRKNSTRTMMTALALITYGISDVGMNRAQADFYSGDLSTIGCTICETGPNIDVVTEGNLNSDTSYAISTSSDANTSIITAPDKHINAWIGISASTSSSGLSLVDMTITNHSNIDSRANGIEANDSKYGNLLITNNGNINSSEGTGIAVSHQVSNNQQQPNTTNVITNGIVTGANTGIFAATNASGSLSIQANADISGGQSGIQATSSDAGSITINTAGHVSATNPNDHYSIRYYPDNQPPQASVKTHSPLGSISAFTDSGSLQISTAAGKTISSISNGISATSKSGAVTINNASDIKTTFFIRDSAFCSELAGGCSIPELERVAGNGIDVSQALGGSTIQNSGNIDVQKSGFLMPAGKVILGGEAIEKVTSNEGTLTGDIDLASGDDELNLRGGALVGSATMGLGNDVLTINGIVDLSQTAQLDGGTQTSIPENPTTPETDNLVIETAYVTGMTAGTNNISKGSNLTGWEKISLINGGTLKLAGDLFDADGGVYIDNTSLLDLSGVNSISIHGSVQNQGYLTMYNGVANNETTITGNFTGGGDSRIYFDVNLNGDNSQADKLIIKGNTTGKTEINVFNANGTGAQTVEGIKIIQVDGASNGQFNLAVPVQAGSYEYRLSQNGISTPDDGDWYLRSTFVEDCPEDDTNCGGGGGTIDPTTLYRPGITAYVTERQYNADAGLSFMSATHQRIGEQRTLAQDNSQTWARTLLSTQRNKGKSRFEYDQTTSGLQFGHDFFKRLTASGTQHRAGMSAQYAYSRIDTRDRLRPYAGFNESAGSVGSTLVGTGAYYTQVKKNGRYLDVVAQLNHIRNKFVDVYVGKATQNAWQSGLSVEIGQPIGHLGAWRIEPQIQMSYLHTNYDSIKDDLSIIKAHSSNDLRGRIGLRLDKEAVIAGQTATYYGIANLTHNFLHPNSTTHIIDKTDGSLVDVPEEFDATAFELGAGVQGKVGESSYLYADARFQRSLNHRKSGAQFNVGFKKSF